MATNATPKESSIVEKSAGQDGEFQQVIDQLDPEDKTQFEEWMQVASNIKIMVTGETGVGKSTLLNAIVGKKVFEIGRKNKQRVTTKVSRHSCYKDGVEIIVFDCPGLHDGTEHEDQYIRDMKSMIDTHGGLDLMLYCQKMDETRADFEGSCDVIKKLTNGLGTAIWKHTLFVFTHANIYEKQLKARFPPSKVNAKFKEKKEEWKDVLRDVMTACNIEYRVKVCVAGSARKCKLCDSEYWLSDIWAAAYKIQDENGALALLRLSKSRLIDASSAKEQPERFQGDLDEQPIVVTSKVKKALGIGGVAGAGAAIGATIGATIGAVGIGVLSFGPAAGIGLALGGFVGAAIGSTVGGAILVLYNRRKAKKLAAKK